MVRENCAVGNSAPSFFLLGRDHKPADRVSNPVQRRLRKSRPASGRPDRADPAAGMGVISGKDPRRNDAPFVNQVHVGISGGARRR